MTFLNILEILRMLYFGRRDGEGVVVSDMLSMLQTRPLIS